MTITHILDFVCDGWVGNFKLEFFSYVFGQEDYDHPSRDFSKHLSQEELERFEELFEDFFEGWHGEHDWMLAEIENVRLPGDDEPRRSVRIRISDERWNAVVTPELLVELKERAVSFFEVYLANLPVMRPREGAFLGLMHSVSTTTISAAEVL